MHEAWARLQELETERASLMEQLRRSMAVQEFCPDAFEHGGITTTVLGGRSRGFLYRITRGDGSTRVFDVALVPRAILEDVVRRHSDSKARRFLWKGLQLDVRA